MPALRTDIVSSHTTCMIKCHAPSYSNEFIIAIKLKSMYCINNFCIAFMFLFNVSVRCAQTLPEQQLSVF